MSKSQTLNVRISGPLSEFVSANVGQDGAYENVSEYVRDLGFVLNQLALTVEG